MANYLPILVFILIAILFLMGSLIAARLFRHGGRGLTNREPYECGNEADTLAHDHRFSVRYYLIAVLFVVFDVETIFLFPWAVMFDKRVPVACYRRQRVHRDPFVEVGGQDLTAHIDFSALIDAGEDLGLETVVLTRQAAWLAALGILDGLAEGPPFERVAAMTLLDLEGMGTEIRVLVQARGIDVSSLVDVSLL